MIDEYIKSIPYYEKWVGLDSGAKTKVVGLVIVVIVVIVLCILMVIPGSPLRNWLQSLIEWLESVDIIWRALVLFIIQTIAVMLCLPGTIFNLACGFLLGVWIGSAVSILSTDLAAVLSFLIARYLARDWTAQQVAKRKGPYGIETIIIIILFHNLLI